MVTILLNEKANLYLQLNVCDSFAVQVNELNPFKTISSHMKLVAGTS